MAVLKDSHQRVCELAGAFQKTDVSAGECSSGPRTHLQTRCCLVIFLRLIDSLLQRA